MESVEELHVVAARQPENVAEIIFFQKRNDMLGAGS
jgi:hypothetical protein